MEERKGTEEKKGRVKREKKKGDKKKKRERESPLFTINYFASLPVLSFDGRR